MPTALEEQINQLKGTIPEMEAQRAILGDAAVEASIEPFRQNLVDLESQVAPSSEGQQDYPVRKRKLVTLLYMDVVGSTEMTQHLDHEDTLEIMDAALRKLAVPVESHGGHVTRFTGDGFKAVFGDPLTREDDPELAVRAGLENLDVSNSVARELLFLLCLLKSITSRIQSLSNKELPLVVCNNMTIHFMNCSNSGDINIRWYSKLLWVRVSTPSNCIVDAVSSQRSHCRFLKN